MKILPSLTGVALALAALTGTASAQTTEPGMAERIFEGIEHYDPGDNFVMTASETEKAPIAVESWADFTCLMCAGPYHASLIINWYRSKEAADLDAASRASLETDFPYTMYYLAGQAEMTGPAPLRIVKAFGLAVGEQVVIVEALCCGYANPTIPTG